MTRIQRMLIRIFLSLLGWQLTLFSAFATTNCEQSFILFGLTKNNPKTFWIATHVSGECNVYVLHQIRALGSQVVASDRNFPIEDSSAMRKVVAGIKMEPKISLHRKKGQWVSGESLSVRAPVPDSAYISRFGQHVVEGGSGGKTWNERYGREGIVLPTIGDYEAKLVHFNPYRLYVNYGISRAVFYPQSGYLLLFTQQEMRATGLDTMHGFLIFRLTKKR